MTNGEITEVKNISKLGMWGAIRGKGEEILRRTWPCEHPGNWKQNFWTWANNQRGVSGRSYPRTRQGPTLGGN